MAQVHTPHVVFDLSPGGSGVNLSGDDRPGLAIMSAIIETVATKEAGLPILRKERGTTRTSTPWATARKSRAHQATEVLTSSPTATPWAWSRRSSRSSASAQRQAPAVPMCSDSRALSRSGEQSLDYSSRSAPIRRTPSTSRTRQDIRLINGNELVELIFQHYAQFSPEYKLLLPMRSVHVVDRSPEGT
jgi:hypothetical protein